MLKHLTAYFGCNSNLFNDYWIAVEWYCGIQSYIISIIVKYHSFFPFYVRCPSTILKFLQDLLKLAFFFIFRYIFGMSFTWNKVFYFSQVHVFSACHLLIFILNQKEKHGFIWP